MLTRPDESSPGFELPIGAAMDSPAVMSRTRFWLLVALIGSGALLLRLPTLASRSLWLDDTYSAWFAALPLHELWTGIGRYEIHPPLYYTLLKAWSALFGSGEAALRGLSVLASVLTVVAIPVGARLARLGPRAEHIALLAALFLAVNANSILYAHQVRPYALQTLAASLAVLFSCLLLAELARRGTSRPAAVPPVSATASSAHASADPAADKRRLRRIGAGLAVSAGLTLWLHNTSVFAAFAIWTGMAVALLLATPGQRRLHLLALASSGIGALLVWSPFLPMLVQESAAMAKMTYWVSFKPANVISAWTVISGAPVMHYPVAALVLVGYWWLWRHARAQFWHLLCVMALPVLAMAAYSYAVKPVFLSRLFEWLAPLGMVLLALGVVTLRPRWRLPVVAVVLALSAQSVLGYYRMQTENWREMLAQLARESRPGDLVLALPNEIQMPVSYYMKAPPVVYLPGPFPTTDLPRRYIGNPGAPDIAPADMARLRTLLPGHRRVWVIERRPDLYDPDGLLAKELRRRYRVTGTIDGIGATLRLYESVDNGAVGSGAPGGTSR